MLFIFNLVIHITEMMTATFFVNSIFMILPSPTFILKGKMDSSQHLPFIFPPNLTHFWVPYSDITIQTHLMICYYFSIYYLLSQWSLNIFQSYFLLFLNSSIAVFEATQSVNLGIFSSTELTFTGLISNAQSHKSTCF